MYTYRAALQLTDAMINVNTLRVKNQSDLQVTDRKINIEQGLFPVMQRDRSEKCMTGNAGIESTNTSTTIPKNAEHESISNLLAN